MNTKNPIRIAATAVLFAAFAAGAQGADFPQVHVKYADLNLSTAAGATVLYQRIRGAADQVCGVSSNRDLARLEQVKACTAHAVADAVAVVNAPALTSIYHTKVGGAAVTRLAVNR
jgi:UrcA family protein